ncbi:hypothetical protein F7U66_10955 [Vibrio parahaemolyticus]|nr:hypothetical protein [Vibrio parahaemolyticus]
MRTRRFCFFTGGTDSTLVLEQQLNIITKKEEDDIVVVTVLSSFMRSGQLESFQEAMRSLIGTLLGKFDTTFEEMSSRIKILPIETCNIVNEGIQTEAKGSDGRTFSINLETAEPDPNFRPFIKQMIMQEPILLSAVPGLIPFLCNGKNKFYLGTCGSDLAANNVEKYKLIFDTLIESMVLLPRNFDLDKELIESGFKPLNRYGQGEFPNHALPTLHFPLISLKKQDVITMLIHSNSRNFVAQKNEHLLSYYGVESGGELEIYTGAYHKINAYYNYNRTLTSLTDFIRSGKLSLTIDDKKIDVPEEHVQLLLDEQRTALMAKLFNF